MTFYSLLILLSLAGCKKEKGEIVVNFKYTASGVQQKSAYSEAGRKFVQEASDDYYGQFGSYIMSLSPTKFTAKFRTIRFQDNRDEQKRAMLELINNNAPVNAPERFADFTNNSVVSFV